MYRKNLPRPARRIDFQATPPDRDQVGENAGFQPKRGSLWENRQISTKCLKTNTMNL
jgi:hypothetical protein